MFRLKFNTSVTNKMKFIGIIPARYQSSRFPGKPLVNINGKPMIQHVYQQSLKCKHLSDLAVATDDQRIYDVLQTIGAKVIMTSPLHSSGTERCFEAAQHLNIPFDAEHVLINIQGDEPFINPAQIEQVIEPFYHAQTQIATLLKKIQDSQTLFNPNVVKCVFDEQEKAVYFSRNPIPYLRNFDKEHWIEKHDFYKHIGIYAYRADILRQLVVLKTSKLEQAESLEQLRWLENAYTITIRKTQFESKAIDTPEDLENLLHKVNEL